MMMAHSADIHPQEEHQAMTSERIIDRDHLEAVLAALGPAHHAAYLDTDGVDPEWPR